MGGLQDWKAEWMTGLQKLQLPIRLISELVVLLKSSIRMMRLRNSEKDKEFQRQSIRTGLILYGKSEMEKRYAVFTW